MSTADELPPEDEVELTAPKPPAPPAPPVDHHHVHRRLERLLGVLEQQGIVTGEDLHIVRHTP